MVNGALFVMMISTVITMQLKLLANSLVSHILALFGQMQEVQEVFGLTTSIAMVLKQAFSIAPIMLLEVTIAIIVKMLASDAETEQPIDRKYTPIVIMR